MPRTASKQAAKGARDRTAKWRADRAQRKAPDARQVDRAVLLALLHVSRLGTATMIDEARLQEAWGIAVRLLSRHHDRSESILAVQKRVGALSNSIEVREMLLMERTTRTSEG